ncbi:ABC transporter ATP-binding protein [Pseudoruegeria sp. SHC-113]|uniref:ABC transporter ATP-binding protein n=1 Tax=Pseudoruegeria sp. SHC-113 TaxID=2855439 RepID=UPI0021BABDDC|nr:sn-glycerol-3-phosphate ABC transporter ATP-binding protein UgpC [Pseudoruegeria sp. SHC-113]MCT8162145.1 sn-glycerol-3-phosphate ABC transporter ATP-binding protein UgpC [Pseudoruegeria sp. SHC-113]
MASVTLQGLRKSYGAHAVIHGADLTVEDGEFVVFVGPSGCGKSTLLRMIAGLEDISGGELQIGATRMNDTEPGERGVAMVFQTYALYPHMSVEANMGFGMRMTGHAKPETETRVRSAADVLQLAPLLARLPKALSGGQRQRVAIGRAIVREPDVFLFDEPLSNLDAELRVKMRVEIARLHGELGATMIYVTHDQTEAMTLADRIVVLRDGRIEQVGAPLDLYHRPANRFVAGFIGSPMMNFFEGTVTGAGQVTLEAHPECRLALPQAKALPHGAAVTLGIRPEHFAPAPLPEGNLTLTIDVIERLGALSYAYAETKGDAPVIVARPEDASEDRPGGQITVGIRPERAHLFAADGTRLP